MTYEIPPRVQPSNDSGYLEQITKAIFQAGFSWQVIADKWPAFQRAFDDFHIDVVAAYDSPDLERLLVDESIVRNGRKIMATIHNARVVKQLINEHGSFFRYLRSLDGLTYAQRRKELTTAFNHLGPTGTFVFLWCVDEQVPDWEDRAR